MGPKETKETRDRLDVKDPRDLPENPERNTAKDRPDILELLESEAVLESPVRTERLDPEERTAVPDTLDQPESPETVAWMDIPEPLARTEATDPMPATASAHHEIMLRFFEKMKHLFKFCLTSGVKETRLGKLQTFCEALRILEIRVASKQNIEHKIYVSRPLTDRNRINLKISES